MRRAIGLAMLLILLPGAASAADGERLFKLQCKGCHAGGQGDPGPALPGVFGAKIASRPGFTYSAGLQARTGVWDAASLDAFLTSPTAFAPGAVMPKPSLATPQDRAAVIEYLKTLR